MNICEYVNTCNFANELPAVNDLLASAQESVSFWGNRVITVSGYKGTISLNQVARKVLQAIQKRSDAEDMSKEEIRAGREVVRKLRTLYTVTDTKICNAHWFTRLLNMIREFSFFSTPQTRILNLATKIDAQPLIT